jgi:NifB/MoaA-like Fe-S oxidoreductase
MRGAMTQTNETDTTRSRFERLEALTLEIAAANMRHDRNFERLNEASLRHDEELKAFRAAMVEQQKRSDEEFSQMRAAMAEQRKRSDEEFQAIRAAMAEQQRHNDEEFNRINATLNHVSQQQQLNQEQLNQFTAGMVELRNLVADYIQGRSTLPPEE